jgi:hypothetical protein
MKKLIMFSMLLLASLGANAQKVESASLNERQELSTNNDAKMLAVEFKRMASKKAIFVEEGCIRFSGKDMSGQYDITMVTSQISEKGIEVIVLKNNLTNETVAYAEDGIKVYSVENNKMISRPFAPEASTNKSIGGCFQQNKKGLANCPNCITCVNNCWTKNKKWKRIACAVSSCGGSCFSCVTSLWGFVNCVFS